MKFLDNYQGVTGYFISEGFNSQPIGIFKIECLSSTPKGSDAIMACRGPMVNFRKLELLWVKSPKDLCYIYASNSSFASCRAADLAFDKESLVILFNNLNSIYHKKLLGWIQEFKDKLLFHQERCKVLQNAIDDLDSKRLALESLEFPNTPFIN